MKCVSVYNNSVLTYLFFQETLDGGAGGRTGGQGSDDPQLIKHCLVQLNRCMILCQDHFHQKTQTDTLAQTIPVSMTIVHVDSDES